jgi:CHAD domain-containing protein
MTENESRWEFETADARRVRRWATSRDLDATPAVFPRGPARTTRVVLLDTSTRRLLRAGLALRTSRLGRTLRAELLPLHAGAAVAASHAEDLDARDPDAMRSASGAVGARVRMLVGRAPLRELAGVRVRETRFDLRDAVDVLGTLVLEDAAVETAASTRRRPHVARVRVESVSADARLRLAPFVASMVAALELHETRAGDVESWLAAGGVAVPRASDLGSTEISAGSTLGETAFATLRAQFAVFVEKEAGTRLGDDPEQLHDMRVASRRLRAAMRLFESALPPRLLELREDLADVAAALGEVRDLDVQLERFAEWAARDPRLAAAVLDPRHRVEARRRMLALLDSARYRTFRRRFAAALRRGPVRGDPAASTPILAAAPDLVFARRKKVRKAAKRIDFESPPAAYHALRILCKRLRYALEFLAGVYGRPAEDFAKRIADVQDLLGRHQDASVAIGLVEGVLDRGDALPPATAFAMGVAAERSRQEAAGLRRLFPRVYERTKGRPWRRLERAMERRRPSADASAGGPSRTAKIARRAGGPSA